MRERRDDIAALAEHFLVKHAADHGRSPRLHPDVVPRPREYDWPGNVRELENLVQRALVMAMNDLVTVEDFCFVLPGPLAVISTPTSGDCDEEVS